jgi:hypothetical protein
MAEVGTHLVEGDKTKQDGGMTVTTCVEAKICGLPVISAVIVSTDSALKVASTACLLQTNPFT